MKRIYLDYAATSPTKKEVLQAMKPYFFDKFGNPSSLHRFGQETRAAILEARNTVAKFLNCGAQEIIFTSGGSESDNFVLRGISNRWHKPHIIISAIEHYAILHTCQDLEKQNLIEATYLPVDKFGLVSVSDVKKAIRKNTILVSIMYANNEIGTIEPIREIGKMIEKLKTQNSNPKSYFERSEKKGSRATVRGPYFHTDAVQAIGYLNCNVRYLHADALSLSAHKFGGPKGVGVLYIRKGIKLSSQITGGGQEYGKRAGTENIPGIIGLAKAISLIGDKKYKLRIKKITTLRDRLISGVLKTIPDVILTGHPKERLPNSVSFCFKYIEGEGILYNLDLAGVAASSGSACTSGSLEPSHVLIACGYDHKTAQGSIRFTLGEDTKEEEIEYVLKILPPIVKKLRNLSPYYSDSKFKNNF